jgi:hypothetical protein
MDYGPAIFDRKHGFTLAHTTQFPLVWDRVMARTPPWRKHHKSQALGQDSRSIVSGAGYWAYCSRSA